MFVHMWISTEKSLFLFYSLKVVVIYTISDMKEKIGKNEIIKSKWGLLFIF